uniref:Uncharacterized protein n=1 Tax=Oryza nivara TaxID=4536 RepID=A0A0E0J4V4_ORYNI
MLCSRRTPSFLRSSSSGLHSRRRSCRWPFFHVTKLVVIKALDIYRRTRNLPLQ